LAEEPEWLWFVSPEIEPAEADGARYYSITDDFEVNIDPDIIEV
jgi:hypothetical protein